MMLYHLRVMFTWARFGVASTWRILKWIILIALPLHAFFYGVGLIEGGFLYSHRAQVMDRAEHHFGDNVDSARSMDYFSVPGAPGIHDVGFAPYHVPQIRDPTNWWQRLGLKRLDISADDLANVPIGSFADLDLLYRRVRTFEVDKTPFHHFVYLSDSILHIEDHFFSAWDEAFYQLLQYHYVHPAVGNAGFHFIACPGSFLCDIWDTRGPALLHLTTERADLWAEEDYDLAQRTPVFGHQPVAVRLIELPLTKPMDLHLLPGVFPSPFEQMRSVTEDPTGWQLYATYAVMSQLAARMDDVCDEKKKEFPLTYGRLSKVEDWLWDVFGSNEATELWLSAVYLFGVASSLLVGRGAEITMTYIGDAMRSFLGTHHEAQVEHGEDEAEGGEPQHPREDNFMAQMVRDFLDNLDDDLEDKIKESEEGRKAMERIWDVVRRKPDEDECDGEGCAE
jgi:hypothetical protein